MIFQEMWTFGKMPDSWKVVLTKVPIILDFSDSESPYLLAGFKNKLRILTKDVNDCVIVLGADMNDEGVSITNSSSSPLPLEPTANGSSSITEAERWKVSE